MAPTERRSSTPTGCSTDEPPHGRYARAGRLRPRACLYEHAQLGVPLLCGGERARGFCRGPKTGCASARSTGRTFVWRKQAVPVSVAPRAQRSRGWIAIAGTRTSALERSPICFGRNSVPMERDSVSAPNRSKTIDRKRSDVDVLIVPQETSRRISSRRENRSPIANRVGPLCVLRLCVICRGVEEVDSVVSGVGSPGDERSGLVDRSARTVARRWGWSRHRNRASGRVMPSDRADV
jgi:hypothetical protein